MPSSLRAEVVRVGKLEKHENADSLSVTTIFGYPLVVRSSDFKEGDLAIYVPVDAMVPTDRPEFAFLADRARADGKARIKAMKLRGVFSMGLLVPAPPYRDEPNLQTSVRVQEGDDLTTDFGITKYEPPPAHTPGTNLGKADEADPPPFTVGYTDIEHLRRYSALFSPDEIVYATEKVHGCVPANARIAMADGSFKAISQVEVGEEVLGVDERGAVVPTMVLNACNNGKAEKWLKITGPRRNAGRGSSYFTVRCTPNHRFWNPWAEKYVPAEDLRPGDPVYLLRSEIGLSPLEYQVILGKLLGDAYLHRSANTAAVVWSHREADAEYVEWTARALGQMADAGRESMGSGYGSKMIRARSVFSWYVREEFGDFYQDGKKKAVPAWVADRLDPIAIAFWYMDDGSLSHSRGQEDRASIAVCAFDRESCEVLIRGLAKFGIGAVYHDADGHSRLRLNTEAAERLFLLVAPYVPPGMQHKLPERYRGHAGWLPDSEDGVYRPLLVPQVISSVEEDQNVKSARYDIETATHNYFVNGVLTHNSNARYSWQNDQMYIGSHRRWLQPGDTIWHRAFEKYPQIEEFCREHPASILFGEVFGKVQDLRYGLGDGIDFAAFDVWDPQQPDGGYLPYEDFQFEMVKYDIPAVPIVYRGPFDLDRIAGFAEADSLISMTSQLMEGVVVRPEKERWNKRSGRVCLKLHSQRYLLRRDADKEVVHA